MQRQLSRALDCAKRFVLDISSGAWVDGSPKVGVIGFCMDGALTIASALCISEVDAVVASYGIPPPELPDPTQAKASVQAHFGQNDPIKGFSDVEIAKESNMEGISDSF